jgi:hypothetical protein
MPGAWVSGRFGLEGEAPLRGDLCCLRLFYALGYLVEGPLDQLLLVQRPINQHWRVRARAPNMGIWGITGTTCPTRLPRSGT